jgi:hypothetical protein
MSPASSEKQIVLRPVAKGGEISVEVEGGFVRRQAPCDGVSIETESQSFFVPADKLEEALAKLGREAGRKPAPGRR